MNLAYPLAAVAIGVAFAAQPAINGAAARMLASPVAAATLSVAITLIASLALLLAMRSAPASSAILTLPWWIVLGGLIGVLVVAGGAAIAPVTGVAVFFVCLLTGQLFGAVLLDHLGAFDLPPREISATRAAGVALAVLGAVLVNLGR